MYKKVISFCLLFSMLAASFVNVNANEVEITDNCIYVSPTGNDNNNGTIDSPLKTLKAAKSMVSSVKKVSDKPITVYFRGGTYQWQETVPFGREDSGTESAPIKYTSYNNEEVIFTGARKIHATNFQMVTDEDILNKLPSEAHSKVGVIDLSAEGINKIDAFAPAPSYGLVAENGTMNVGLFFNGKEQTLARYPNGANQTLTVEGVSGNNIIFSDDRPLRWVNAKDAYIMGGIRLNWTFARTPLLGIDVAKKEIIQNGPHVPQTRGFWSVQNLLEELDMPGEYYVDEENRLLYFYPPYSVVGSEIEVTTDNIGFLKIEGASNIIFENLSFQKIRRSAAIVKDCDNVDFIGCKFSDIMMHGVQTEQCKNCDVIDCDFSIIGSAAIILDGGSNMKNLKTELTGLEEFEYGNNTAVNNHIFRPGDKQRTYTGGVQITGVGNSVINNEIHNVPHQAIRFDGIEHKIMYNEIYDAVKECVDSGAIYSDWGIIEYGNEIAYNYIHDINPIIKDGAHAASGIYMDDMYSGMNIHHNVLDNVDKPILIGGGANNKVEDNIIINSRLSGTIEARGAGWAKEQATWEGGQGALNTYEKVPALQKYPDIKTVAEITVENGAFYPALSSVAGNLFYNNGTPPEIHEAYNNPEKFKTKTENNIITTSVNKEAEGIEFVDESQKNYAIKEGAKILEKLPGLAEIDFSKIGLQDTKYMSKDVAKLGTFRQYYPFNGTTEITNYGTYAEWENCENADYYKVTIARDKDFTDIISEEIFYYNYAELKEITTGLLDQYWKVEAISNGKNHFASKPGEYGVFRFTSSMYDQVDTTSIDNAIINAQRFVEKLNEGTAPGCVPVGSKKMIEDLLGEAASLLALDHFSQLEADIIAEKLNVAMEEIGYHAHKSYGNVDFLFEDPDGWYSQTEGVQVSSQDGVINFIHPDSNYRATYLTKPVDKTKIMCFNVDSVPAEGWMGIAIQAKGNAGASIYSGEIQNRRGYLMVIKNTLIELQKWDGTNKLWSLENNMYTPGEYNRIEFGAIDFGGGNRIVLNINGIELFDYVDFDMPIDEDLYFTINPSGNTKDELTTYFNLKSTNDVPDNEIFAFTTEETEEVKLNELFPTSGGELNVSSKVVSADRVDNDKEIAFTLERLSGNKEAIVSFRDANSDDIKNNYEIRINNDHIALYRYNLGNMQAVCAVDNKYIQEGKPVELGIKTYSTRDGLKIILTSNGETIMDAVDIYPVKVKGYVGFEAVGGGIRIK